MSKLKIALLRERKLPGDNRVCLSPAQCGLVKQKFPGLDIVVEPSPIRCFTDEEYIAAGIEVTKDLSDCDILMGIKEVPVEYLMAGKIYYFFSHTLKKQPHNQLLMQGLIEKRITMVDYECFVDDSGARTIGFGHYAGIVGAHNGLLAYGNRTQAYILKAAHDVSSYHELLQDYKNIVLPPVKIAITGSGRVGKGAVEHLRQVGIQEVSVKDYFFTPFAHPVFVWLKGADLYRNRLTLGYDRSEFHKHPGYYESLFGPYCTCTDIFMNAVYWDPHAPVFFTKDDMRSPHFKIRTVADITCDVNGSVPCTIHDTTIHDPIFGYDIYTEHATRPYQSHTIDVMAVSNLPNELPREASEEFGNNVIQVILPEVHDVTSEVVGRATLCTGGHLTARFDYLSDYAAV
jgi:alanine dehydrogenase